MRKALNIISWITILLVFILLVAVGYNSIFPLKVATVESPAKVINKEVKAGEALEYELEICVYHEGQITINKRVIDGIVYVLPSTTTISPPKGCHSYIAQAFVVPAHLPTGEYTLEIESVWELNFIRNKIISYETETFNIIE